MRASMIFFDGRYNSFVGLMRGITMFPYILGIIAISGGNLTTVNSILLSVLIVSALGVINPINRTEAAVIGFLVGVCIAGSILFTHGDCGRWDRVMRLCLATLLGSIVCSIFIYQLSQRHIFLRFENL